MLHRHIKEADVPITTRETRAMIVFYLCPRPITLVSVSDGQRNNMFTMNLMGSVGNGYFAFALNSSRAAAPLIEQAKTAVLSSIPFQQARLASKLGSNHRKHFITWDQLPFATTTSESVGLPVPDFSLRIRKMQVEAVHRLGSHTLFVAKTLVDEQIADDLQFFVVHGIYMARRQNMGNSSITANS